MLIQQQQLIINKMQNILHQLPWNTSV